MGESKIKRRVIKGALGVIAFMCIVGWGPMPMQCAPAPIPEPQCNSQIQRQDLNPDVLFVQCSSGEGWIEVEYQCSSIKLIGGFGWWSDFEKKEYRPNGYTNGSSDPMYAPIFTVDAHCTSAQPYLWWDTVAVYTYK